MKCPKCENLMVAERFTDYQQSGEINFIGWRCLSCGLILDPMILLNRNQRISGHLGSGHRATTAGHRTPGREV
jgi:hypothetical protein